MQVFKALPEFTAERAWGATQLGEIDDVTVRVHWTDKAYVWHENTGAETFMVLAGAVDMHVREAGEERVVRLDAGDAMQIQHGEEHKAVPVGPARILVVERRDSD